MRIIQALGALVVFLLLGLTFAAMAWGSLPSFDIGPLREILACTLGFSLSYLLLNLGEPKAHHEKGFII